MMLSRRRCRVSSGTPWHHQQPPPPTLLQVSPLTSRHPPTLPLRGVPAHLSHIHPRAASHTHHPPRIPPCPHTTDPPPTPPPPPHTPSQPWLTRPSLQTPRVPLTRRWRPTPRCWRCCCAATPWRGHRGGGRPSWTRWGPGAGVGEGVGREGSCPRVVKGSLSIGGGHKIQPNQYSHQ
jgi:hypothetical protein